MAKTATEPIEPEGAGAQSEMTGAEILVQALKDEGVDVLFGYPGGAVLNVYDALYDAGIAHILTRHEQGAIHAAEGYARVTGRPGVVLVTSGPGATNIMTGLTDAMIDSLPVVVIAGQVGTNVMGTDAFQEAPIFSMSMPVTKYNYQVRDPKDLPRIVQEAFHIATTGRPGPVLIDLPKDVTARTAPYVRPRALDLPGYQPTVVPNALQLQKLAAAIARSRRPLILAGAGVLHARAGDALVSFAERLGIPVVTTLLGIGAIPANHPLYLGMGGMHGTAVANYALQECDLLINFGARFDDRLTGNPARFAPKARIAHIDIDPAEIGKIVPTEIPIVGDAGEALRRLLELDLAPPDAAAWREALRQVARERPLWYLPSGELKPQRVVELLSEMTRGEAIVVTDVGQHQMWTAQYYRFQKPHRWVTSGGLGAMGFGFPAAIGAKIAARDETVLAVVGDAGFQMTMQELALLREYALGVKIIILNNFALGMVRQWQELFYEKRYSESLLPFQPDYVKLAEAYGIPGYAVSTEADLRAVLERHLADDEPVLIDCRIAPGENVFPMIPPGKALDEIVGDRPPDGAEAIRSPGTVGIAGKEVGAP
ncbi:biosynthetic-type acetolactate synthase large subunit [Hydrogenibacillus schlegelii]|nr:biosynthetic-type acetolactate synthase large subunit [Hydrogenibacillus schlegelii]KWW97213.1 acetolactate synthase catalytic subunit [Hydrogenibacillus schlegelii]MBT9283039.1 biosynthetic-type acetolactate synthase large subunit [Hydrogenibacillus schlegelii]OAR05383.1 acetolactate synthase catalytic subunit [Hydrogenibacillus schlegelii]